VARHLRLRGHRVVAWDRKAVDLGEPERIDDHFGAAAYDAVVHCAAATSLEWCELNPEEAAVVNAEASGRIARHCREQGARMVQVSTDYVYDGTVPGLRREGDLLAPCGVYARTKLGGGERGAGGGGAGVVGVRAGPAGVSGSID
jgi:dTDP-4-dehydrorhamnose reductase